MQLSGHIKNLRPSQKKNLDRLFRRKLDEDEIISRDLARELLENAEDLRRRLALLVDRDGEILEVIVGTHELVMLPDLGRYRVSEGRLRRIRLIVTDHRTKHETAMIPQDMYTDLLKLRLDGVIAVKQNQNRIAFSLAYLDADNPSRAVTVQENDLQKLPTGYFSQLEEIERNLEKKKSQHTSSGKVRALLVGVYGRGEDDESSMLELSELARTAELEVVGDIRQRKTPDPKTLLGRGKLEELNLKALEDDIDMLVFDTELRPSQWRAITNATELKVIDRSMLILDIFAKRASSAEGRLQVELAQLRYNLPKLVEKDAGLSRLTGGIGGQGPGETKLEIGRRRIRERISFLEKKIEGLSQQRDLRSKRREESGAPLVSLIGYTNVGKSTLFNALTKSQVVAENKLFATLEPSKRRIMMPFYAPLSVYEEGRGLREVVFADTVGFIRNLPKELFNAFRATIAEVHQAAVLLHVVDASDPNHRRHYEAVRKVLKDLESDSVPEIVILNKIDLISAEERASLVEFYQAIPVSALKREGFKELFEEVARRVTSAAEDHHEAQSCSTPTF